MELLKINNLTVAFHTALGDMEAVKTVDITLHKGEILALVGESGCGKTVLCKSMLQLLCNRGVVKNGEVLLSGVDLVSLKEEEIQLLRGKEVSMIFQDPMTSLNPSVSIGKQIGEVLFLHEKISKSQVRERVISLLNLVGIDSSEKRLKQLPHEFSGGMRQRVAIAIALAGNPKVLLADEPTTALDMETQSQILQLLKDIQKKTGVAIIFITHDLGLVEAFADRVVVMLGGRIVEEGSVEKIFETPEHAYTKQLMRYVNYGKGKEHVHGKLFENKNHAHEEKVREKLLEVKNLCMTFKVDRHTEIKALDHMNMEVNQGEIVGLIGPSGCGKSTLARCIMNLYQPTSGEILYYGKNKQIIFQDSMSALNPRMTIGEIIGEPLKIQGVCSGKDARRERVNQLMEMVELDQRLITQHPYEISGGQRQRAAIARAISLNPDLIIADEPIASLDVSIQAQIVHLFKKLQEKQGMAILLISHDLPMVEHVSDRIVMLE